MGSYGHPSKYGEEVGEEFSSVISTEIQMSKFGLSLTTVL